MYAGFFYYMTCYQYLTENKIEFTKTDISNIGMAVCAAAKEQGLVYTKIKQQEGKSTFRVSTFPDTFTPTIKQVVETYFEEKKIKEIERAEKAALAKNAIVQKPKKLFKKDPFIDSCLAGSRNNTGKGFIDQIKEPAKKQRRRIPLKAELKKNKI